ncbi:Copia protein [Ooceraea biroi]|uniref:Copia protein n=1 Tax=Ooceraea biroi TaxID=2015173 RepID=A0A026WLT1_OOCBI|nr:Copia protein [Ooceraea biroi]
MCWEARKQRTVALPSVEAEYMAISEAAKEAIYLQSILCDTVKACDRTVLFNDSQGAQRLVQSEGVHHSRTKHIDLRHYFIRDCCASGVIEL